MRLDTVDSATDSQRRADKPYDYAACVAPEPFRILGLKLRPLSLGHCILFERFGCDVLSGKPIERQTLLLAVLICSMRYREFLDFIEQPDFIREIKKWGRRVGLFDLEEKAQLFARYLSAHIPQPHYVLREPSDEAGDWMQNLKITLMTRLGYSESEVMDMPLAAALADYYKLAEADGKIILLSEADMEQAKETARILESLGNKA